MNTRALTTSSRSAPRAHAGTSGVSVMVGAASAGLIAFAAAYALAGGFAVPADYGVPSPQPGPVPTAPAAP